MKKYITISLFIFWAITVAVIVAGLISFNKNNPLDNITQTNSNTTTQNPPLGVKPTSIPPTNINSTLVLTMAELAKHNSSQSCWLLISGKIYDVTTFLNQHPGNASTILPTCGKDATQAYASRGGTGTHSSSANTLLGAFFIGNLNQTVNTTPTNPTTPPIANPNPTIPTSRGDDDDDD